MDSIFYQQLECEYKNTYSESILQFAIVWFNGAVIQFNGVAMRVQCQLQFDSMKAVVQFNPRTDLEPIALSVFSVFSIELNFETKYSPSNLLCSSICWCGYRGYTCTQDLSHAGGWNEPGNEATKCTMLQSLSPGHPSTAGEAKFLPNLNHV